MKYSLVQISTVACGVLADATAYMLGATVTQSMLAGIAVIAVLGTLSYFILFGRKRV